MKPWRGSAIQREEDNSTGRASSARGKSTALWQGAMCGRLLCKRLYSSFLSRSLFAALFLLGVVIIVPLCGA